MTSAPEPHTTDLREYIRVVRARKLQIILVTMGLIAVVMFVTLRQTPIYEGRAKVLVKPIQNVAGGGFSLPVNPNLDTERQLILSTAVAEQAKSDGKLPQSTDTLLAHLNVQVVGDTEVLLIAYDDPNPATAATVANAFATSYVAFRGQQVEAQFTDAASAVQRRINGLQNDLGKLNVRIQQAGTSPQLGELTAQRDELLAQLAVLNQRLLDLQANASAIGSSAQVVQPATTPRSPASPNKVRSGAFALLAGLVLGVGLAFVRERLDDRVKTRQEVERRLGAPVLAAVPRVAGWRKTEDAQLIMRTAPRSPVSEAYRTLGTNIQYIASRRPLKVIMITSALGGDGKTTTCANLAVVLAQAGKRVVLLSADLRRPRLHHFFELKNGEGLSEALSTTSSIAGLTANPGIPNLRLVNAGHIPEDPAALLGSRQAGQLLESLREVADFILIDTPPVLAVADASILAPIVDGTIFVLDASHSSRSALTHARDQMENAGANIVGAVFNNFDPSSSATYPYYYYYQYYQHYALDTDAANGHKPKLPWRRSHREPANGKVEVPLSPIEDR
jgi:tyrosine-protein kinase